MSNSSRSTPPTLSPATSRWNAVEVRSEVETKWCLWPSVRPACFGWRAEAGSSCIATQTRLRLHVRQLRLSAGSTVPMACVAPFYFAQARPNPIIEDDIRAIRARMSRPRVRSPRHEPSDRRTVDAGGALVPWAAQPPCPACWLWSGGCCRQSRQAIAVRTRPSAASRHRPDPRRTRCAGGGGFVYHIG
jgi:hypothetical protein